MRGLGFHTKTWEPTRRRSDTAFGWRLKNDCEEMVIRHRRSEGDSFTAHF
jgi:hypothetical protein